LQQNKITGNETVKVKNLGLLQGPRRERVILFVIAIAGFVAMLQPEWMILTATGAAEVVAGIYFYWSARYAHPARRPKGATR